MRFAAGLSKLKGLLQEILPQNAGEWALRLGPEAGFATIGAVMAPEGTPLQDRAALALEDFAIGAGSSFLGSGLGRGVGGVMYPKGGLPDLERAEKLARAMTAGDILAAPLPMLSPRPIASGVYERAMEGQSKREREAAEQAEEERHIQEALATSVLTGTGALGLYGGTSLLG